MRRFSCFERQLGEGMAVVATLEHNESNEQNAQTMPLRFITAASLFDGHDAAINIMRRILQQNGAEIISRPHARKIREVSRRLRE